MKISKTFRLSEEAVDKLSKQPNQSQYIEDLILGTTPSKSEEKGLTEGRVLFLITQELEKFKKTRLAEPKNEWVDVGSTPQSPDCCKSDKPCKHWVWDSATGDGYVNTITGEVREA